MAQIDWECHLSEQQAEDIDFLMSSAGGGLLFDDACRRVGVNPATVERRAERAAERLRAS